LSVYGRLPRRHALSIGLVWLALTVAFEFVFGRLVMHRPWSQLINDYNVIEGRLVGSVPYLAYPRTVCVFPSSSRPMRAWSGVVLLPEVDSASIAL
jgi:hypothetical protein